jgi:methionine synthase / methylenetetrahydrofolate reductase(NADPH)
MRPAQGIMQADLVLSDGAMGTYFTELSGHETLCCELANLSHPDLIRQIHQQYVAAGARLLRTNTFAAAALIGPDDPDQLAAVCRAGFCIAAESAGDLAYVAADFGPAYNLEPNAAFAAARIMLDAFIEAGADLFILETFADPAEVLPVCSLIRERSPSSLIITSFALSADGITRKGISLGSLAAALDNQPLIDIWGLNCGIGPTHLAEYIRKLPAAGKPLSLMPNSGYPRLENQRLIYGSAPDYFAQATMDFLGGRVRIIGGCCGTTPRHIQAMRQLLDKPAPRGLPQDSLPQLAAASPSRRVVNHFAGKLARGEFTIAVELDPPRDSQMDPLIQAAGQLQLAGVDLLTLADSPLARVKMDSVACAARLFRETGLPVLPHLCCRDRNANALRAILLAAYSEGIRQVLAVTGDVIPESERGFIKPVFNFDSLGLLQLISQMNQDLFADDPFLMAAALDPGVANPDIEMARVLHKQDNGASFLLTQPVFDSSGLDFIRRARASGLKVLIGLMPLLNYRNARYMSQEVPGIRIPAQVINRFASGAEKETSVADGLMITREIAASVRSEADGFYLIAPFNRTDLIIRLMDGLRSDNLL